MLEKIRTALRISTTDLDDELGDYINAGKYDLQRVGIDPAKIIDTDPVMVVVLGLYVKARLDFEQKGERYMLSYESMRNGLALAGDYNV